MTCIDVILLVLPRLSGEAGEDSGFLLCISDALTAHPDIFKWQFCTVDYFGGPPAVPSHNTLPGPFICTSLLFWRWEPYSHLPTQNLQPWIRMFAESGVLHLSSGNTRCSFGRPRKELTGGSESEISQNLCRCCAYRSGGVGCS